MSHLELSIGEEFISKPVTETRRHRTARGVSAPFPLISSPLRSALGGGVRPVASSYVQASGDSCIHSRLSARSFTLGPLAVGRTRSKALPLYLYSVATRRGTRLPPLTMEPSGWHCHAPAEHNTPFVASAITHYRGPLNRAIAGLVIVTLKVVCVCHWLRAPPRYWGSRLMEGEWSCFSSVVVVIIIECVVHLTLCIHVGLRIGQRA